MKRFIDISILGKSFRKIDPISKVSFYWLWSNCDASGCWEIDPDYFEFENGFEFDLENLIEKFAGEIEVSPCGKLILLKSFILVNYGCVKENYNPHKPLLRAIAKNNLVKNSSLDQACFKLEDEEEDKEEEEEEDKGDCQGGKEKPDPNQTNLNDSISLIEKSNLVKKALLDSYQWKESVCRKVRVRKGDTISIEELDKQIAVFVADIEPTEKLWADLSEIKDHFSYWVLKQELKKKEAVSTFKINLHPKLSQ